jgi:hypothetical protein
MALGEFTLKFYIIETNPTPLTNIKSNIIDTMNQIVIENSHFEILDSAFAPNDSEEWAIYNHVDICHKCIDDIYSNYKNEILISYLPGSKYYIFRIIVPDRPNKAISNPTEIINRTALFLIKMVEEWISIRNVRNAHLFSSRIDLNSCDLAGDHFPCYIGFWNWYNMDYFNKYDKVNSEYNKILITNHFHEGIIWQVFTDYTDLPTNEFIDKVKRIQLIENNLKILIGYSKKYNLTKVAT